MKSSWAFTKHYWEVDGEVRGRWVPQATHISAESIAVRAQQVRERCYTEDRHLKVPCSTQAEHASGRDAFIRTYRSSQMDSRQNYDSLSTSTEGPKWQERGKVPRTIAFPGIECLDWQLDWRLESHLLAGYFQRDRDYQTRWGGGFVRAQGLQNALGQRFSTSIPAPFTSFCPLPLLVPAKAFSMQSSPVFFMS